MGEREEQTHVNALGCEREEGFLENKEDFPIPADIGYINTYTYIFIFVNIQIYIYIYIPKHSKCNRL